MITVMKKRVWHCYRTRRYTWRKRAVFAAPYLQRLPSHLYSLWLLNGRYDAIPRREWIDSRAPHHAPAPLESPAEHRGKPACGFSLNGLPQCRPMGQ